MKLHIEPQCVAFLTKNGISDVQFCLLTLYNEITFGNVNYMKNCE